LTQFRRQAYDKSVVGVATTSHLIERAIVNWELMDLPSIGIHDHLEVSKVGHFRQAETRIA
jgi:hypothetical protein